MAKLDSFIALLVEKDGTDITLRSGHPAHLAAGDASRAITREPVTARQILALLRGIAPDAIRSQLDEDDGRLAFDYVHDGASVDVEAAWSGDEMHATIRPARARRSTASFSTPASGLDMTPARTSGAEEVPAGGPGEERLQELLTRLVESDSSDLHLRVGLPPTYRTDGALHPEEGTAPLTRDEIDEMVMAIMPDRNRREFAETNDTDFAYEMIGVARFRVNALRDRLGTGAVFRVIPSEILTAEQLHIPPEVQKLCHLTKGLVVVTGPTGSGKSTTLAALVDLMNRTRTDHILTIEDPIEFVHANKQCIVTQRQVGSHTQSFKRALRAALREDPDIILIGEMRDLETVAIAIETAETGHLVFGTLHTTTAVSSVDRIIDQFPADRQDQIRVMLSESLKGVISQVLCKKIGGGRVAAHEILLSVGAVANLIREGKTFQLPSVIQTNKRLGMITLNDSLLSLVDQKVIAPEEAYVKSVDKGGIESGLKARGLTLDLEADAPAVKTRRPAQN